MKLNYLAFGLLGLAMAANATDPVIGPQIRTDVNGGTAAANETSATSFSPLGNEIIGAYNDWRAGSQQNEVIRLGVSLSNNGGVNWTDYVVRPPANNQSGVEGDPMTAYDERTGTLWVGAISFAGNGGLYVARKDPGANTFQPSIMARPTGGADKCWMGAGPLPGNPNSTVLYITYNEGCIRSTDMGLTWNSPVPLGSGIGFLPRVAPNGNLYVTYWDFGTGVMFRKSTDGGLTFSSAVRAATRMDTWSTQDGSRGPGNFRKPAMNTMAIDPNTGAIYIVYWDTTNIINNKRNLDMYIVKSTDAGASWSTPKIINNDANPPGDQFFGWLEIDHKSRMHLTWWDSRQHDQPDGQTGGLYDNYYAFSDDGFTTWKEYRLTAASWSSANDGLARGQEFVGDYNGLTFGGNRSYPYYLSTQDGDPNMYTNIVIDPDVAALGFTIKRGTNGGGGLTDTFKSDDLKLKINSANLGASVDDPAIVEFDAVSPVQSPSSYKFTIEASNNIAGATHNVDAMNWTNGQWENVISRAGSTTDSAVTVDLTAGASKYIQNGTRKMKFRSRWRMGGPAGVANFRSDIDQVLWTCLP